MKRTNLFVVLLGLATMISLWGSDKSFSPVVVIWEDETKQIAPMTRINVPYVRLSDNAETFAGNISRAVAKLDTNIPVKVKYILYNGKNLLEIPNFKVSDLTQVSTIRVFLESAVPKGYGWEDY